MKILIVTAHPDDLEFNMGASLHRLMQIPENEIRIHVMSASTTIPGNENIKEELDSSEKLIGMEIHRKNFETMYFMRDYQDIRNAVFAVKQHYNPDIVFCTSPKSKHPDHRVIGEACDSIFLESTVYAMEDVRGNQEQQINMWIEVSERDLIFQKKLIECYKSQHHRPYFDFVKIEALSRARGLQIGRDYAEGFEIIREIQ